VVNTGASVVTFLMVFLIQNTQNRNAQAMQLKLNELIRAVSTARNIMMDLENCTEERIGRDPRRVRGYSQQGNREAYPT